MSDATFTYLQREGRWPGFTLVNLERSRAGRLALARVPRVVEVLGRQEAGAPSVPPPVAPAGIAVAPGTCDLYSADPAGHCIWRLDTCTGATDPLPTWQGPGSLPGALNTPRGLAISGPPGAARLFVADSGNHRIQVIDLETQQPLAVWGQPDPYLPPEPDAAPGRLNDPWDLAVDAAGALYVVDHGNARVQKFTPGGQVDPRFAAAVAAQPNVPLEPVALAVAGPAGAEQIYVLDRNGGTPRICIFDSAGQAATRAAAWPVPGHSAPLSLAVTGRTVYIGDATGTLARVSRAGRLLSTLPGAGQPLAALALGDDNELLAGPGGQPVTRLRLDGGRVPAGYFRAGPFALREAAETWQRWRVLVDDLPPGTYIQLFTTITPDRHPPPQGADPFQGWVRQPQDTLDVLVLSPALRAHLGAGRPAPPAAARDLAAPAPGYFWLGGLLRGDGQAGPVIRQMRLDARPPTALRHLPAIYREGDQRRFLELLLAALESALGGIEEQIAGLPALFDPAAAPPAWLPWLAGWLDLDLREDWPEGKLRGVLAEAMRLYGLRGTARGLRRYLQIYADVEARIEEPGLNAALFVLDDEVALGFNTMLAPAHEQGAVLASTAVVGQSHLLPVEDIGVPLFADVAHRFCVQVYAADLPDAGAQAQVAWVLDREKPAHTDYHLCVIEPRMRVGFQARIGIDSIVAGPAPALRLGSPAVAGADLMLADDPPHTGRLGQGLRVGDRL